MSKCISRSVGKVSERLEALDSKVIEGRSKKLTFLEKMNEVYSRKDNYKITFIEA